MRTCLVLCLHLVVSVAKLRGPGGTRGLLAETLLLKHQLLVINRVRRKAPNLTSGERILLGIWSLFMKPGRIKKSAAIVSPVTLFKFHEVLKKRKYRLLFSGQRQSKPGPKGPSRALVDAIVEMKRRNPRYGWPRIAQQISRAFGVEVDKDVVRRVLAKYYRPGHSGGGPSWLTFIGHMKDSLWSVDLFCCESVSLKTHWVLVVMDQFTRRIIGFGVHAGDVDGTALCCMFNKAIARSGVPKYLSSDNDPLFTYHRWLANLRILEIDELKTAPYTPTSHPFVERLIGSVRRELFDQVFFWNTVDLERKLRSFQRYFNNSRTHASLDGNTPAEICGDVVTHSASLRNFAWEKHCGGLYKHPIAA